MFLRTNHAYQITLDEEEKLNLSNAVVRGRAHARMYVGRLIRKAFMKGVEIGRADKGIETHRKTVAELNKDKYAHAARIKWGRTGRFSTLGERPSLPDPPEKGEKF